MLRPRPDDVGRATSTRQLTAVVSAPTTAEADRLDLAFEFDGALASGTTARLAGATLIWQRADVTYRLDGRLTVDEAPAIAGSVG